MARQQDTSANVRAELARAKLSHRKVALATRMSRGRWAKRMAEPETWTLKELRDVARVLDIPVEVLIGDEGQGES